jgi:hypothetical protein
MKLAFLFLCLAASLDYPARAADLKALSKPNFVAWAQSSEWQNLLHMQKTVWGERSKILGGDFFLNSIGSKNSLAELQTTYQQMFEAATPIQSRIQCRFLARRDFFFRQDPSLKAKAQSCRFSEEWLRRLNATRISLIFASGYMNSAASSFGHTFLKLQSPQNVGGQELLDYGINFAARTQDTQGALYALYGLLGYFPGSFAMLPYHQMIKDYTNLEGRDLWEYELNFSPEEVQRVLFHLLELEGSYVDYYFLDDNCSFMILKALEIGRPGLQLAKDDEFFVIPLDTVKRARNLVSNIRYRPSLETEWRQRRQKLTTEQREEILRLSPDRGPQDLRDLDVVTLSAASYAITLKELEDGQSWKNLNYNVQRELARRKAMDDFRVQMPEHSPDEGHDSSAVEIGFVDQKRQAALVGVRAAFHDSLSRNVGVPPFSHLEVLSLQWLAPEWQQILPRRYRLLETLSTRAISEFEKPISWGVTVGGDAKDQNFIQNQATGRIGYSFDLSPEKIRWTHLIVGGLAQDLANDVQLVVGYDSRLWLNWSERIRSLAQFEWTRFPNFTESNLQMQQAFDLTEQLELRAGWASYESQGHRQIEKRMSLLMNFLL